MLSLLQQVARLVTGVAIANLGDVEAADLHRKGGRNRRHSRQHSYSVRLRACVRAKLLASCVLRRRSGREEEGGRRDSSMHAARSHCD